MAISPKFTPETLQTTHAARPVAANAPPVVASALRADSGSKFSRKLSSWKEVATYLGREVRTVQRWEKNANLPVRRLLHEQRGSVFAYTADLDAWLASRSSSPIAEREESPDQNAQREAAEFSERSGISFQTSAFVAALLVVAALLLSPIARAPRSNSRGAAGAAAAVSPVARDAYERGNYYFHRGTYEDVSASRRYYQRAVDAAPDFAAAFAGLSLTHLMLRGANEKTAGEIAVSRELATRAVTLDSSLAETHDALAMVLAYGDWNWLVAEKEFQRAIELNPNLAQARSDYAQLEAIFGREDIAIAETKRARELEPLSATIGSSLAWDQYWARQYDDAIATSREMLAAEPAYKMARNCTIRAFVVQGKFEEARRELTTRIRESNEDPSTYGLNESVAETAVKNYFEKDLANQHTLYAQKKTGLFMIAIDLAALHRRDELLDLLSAAVKKHEGVPLVMNVEPLFDPYRDDPRFIEIARATGLPPLGRFSAPSSSSALLPSSFWRTLHPSARAIAR
jgi:tetratricopeptide (TPR) repeat protein